MLHCFVAGVVLPGVEDEIRVTARLVAGSGARLLSEAVFTRAGQRSGNAVSIDDELLLPLPARHANAPTSLEFEARSARGATWLATLRWADVAAKAENGWEVEAELKPSGPSEAAGVLLARLLHLVGMAAVSKAAELRSATAAARARVAQEQEAVVLLGGDGQAKINEARSQLARQLATGSLRDRCDAPPSEARESHQSVSCSPSQVHMTWWRRRSPTFGINSRAGCTRPAAAGSSLSPRFTMRPRSTLERNTASDSYLAFQLSQVIEGSPSFNSPHSKHLSSSAAISSKLMAATCCS